MTNFENWKQNIKPEDLIIDNGEDVDDAEFQALRNADARARDFHGNPPRSGRKGELVMAERKYKSVVVTGATLERLHKRRVEMEMESPDHKKMSIEAVILRLLDGEAK